MAVSQRPAGVRFEWGATGAALLAESCAVLVVVDVLSFTTAVSVAVERGIRVHPFPWDGPESAAYAHRTGAVLAAERSAASAEHPWSLSPASLRSAPPVGELVLPSPNGSAICAVASSTGAQVVAACLRNAPAVAGWLLRQGYGTAVRPLGVVAAGELWPDGTLRPAVEDLVGAAAVLDGVAGARGGLSVEAAVTLSVLGAVTDIAAVVRGSASGRELDVAGYGADVDVAVEGGVSTVVPVLRGGVFEPAG